MCYNYFFSIKSLPNCIVCGQPVKFGGNYKFSYNKTCSAKCTGKLNKNSIKKTHIAYNKISDIDIFLIPYQDITNPKIKIYEYLLNFDISSIKIKMFKNEPKLLRFVYEKARCRYFATRNS